MSDESRIDDSALPSVVCSFCFNLLSTNERKCKAFDNIPDKIWGESNTHRKPVKGDRGIQFRWADTNKPDESEEE